VIPHTPGEITILHLAGEAFPAASQIAPAVAAESVEMAEMVLSDVAEDFSQTMD